MPRSKYHVEQSKLCLLMALASSDPERRRLLEAQSRMHLNMAEQEGVDGAADFDTVLEEFNAYQMLKRAPDGSPHTG